VDEEGGEGLLAGQHLDHEPSDVVVEVDDPRLPLDGVRVLLIGVLIGVVVAHCPLMVPGGHDIQMIMN